MKSLFFFFRSKWPVILSRNFAIFFTAVPSCKQKWSNLKQNIYKKKKKWRKISEYQLNIAQRESLPSSPLTNLEIFLHIAVVFLLSLALWPRTPSTKLLPFPSPNILGSAALPSRSTLLPFHQSWQAGPTGTPTNWWPDPSWASQGPCGTPPSYIPAGPHHGEAELAGFEAREPCHDRKKMHLKNENK